MYGILIKNVRESPNSTSNAFSLISITSSPSVKTKLKYMKKRATIALFDNYINMHK